MEDVILVKLVVLFPSQVDDNFTGLNQFSSEFQAVDICFSLTVYTFHFSPLGTLQTNYATPSILALNDTMVIFFIFIFGYFTNYTTLSTQVLNDTVGSSAWL